MKNLKSYLLISTGIVFTALLILPACNSGSKTVTSENGFEYTFLHDEPGDKINVGDGIVVNLKYFIDDSLVREIEGKDFDPFTMPEDSSILSEDNPILELMLYATEGDSVLHEMSYDDIPAQQRPPMEFEIQKTYVKIDDVIPAEELQKMKMEQQAENARILAERKGIFDEVKTSIDESINNHKAGNSGFEELSDGIMIKFLDEGTGDIPQKGETVEAEYIGQLLEDNTVFDQSYQRTEGFKTAAGVGKVIPGWDIILTSVPRGSRVISIIPSELAYGDQGSGSVIKPNSDLVFFMHVLD